LQANKANRHCFFHLQVQVKREKRRPDSSFRVATQATKAKKNEKTRPPALLNGLPLQEGPRKKSPDSNPQLLQSNKPFSL
jgi:hypothetical protein